MPPKKTKKAGDERQSSASLPTLVSQGAGITAGLELWRLAPAGPFFLHDRSTDSRFTADVTTWNSAVTGYILPTALPERG